MKKNGAPTRSCTEFPCLPSKRIAQNALGALKLVGARRLARPRLPGSKPGGSAIPREPRAERLASLTGFAPVISCMRGRHVGWTTPGRQTGLQDQVPWSSSLLHLEPESIPPAVLDIVNSQEQLGTAPCGKCNEGSGRSRPRSHPIGPASSRHVSHSRRGCRRKTTRNWRVTCRYSWPKRSSKVVEAWRSTTK